MFVGGMVSEPGRRTPPRCQFRSGLVPRIFDAPPLHQVEFSLVSYSKSESPREWAMATNMAVKRARKAQRRKQVVAQKRRAEAVEASLPARVLRAANAPIQHCFLTESVFDFGIGTLVLARGATLHHIAVDRFRAAP